MCLVIKKLRPCCLILALRGTLMQPVLEHATAVRSCVDESPVQNAVRVYGRSGYPDGLMNEMPTVVVQPLPEGTDQVTPVQLRRSACFAPSEQPASCWLTSSSAG